MPIICTKCGGTDVSCEAIINPNNKEFKDYTGEAFAYGWCEHCKSGSILTDTDKTRQEIECKFQEFVEKNKCEPKYAICSIVWKDTNEEEDVKIQLSADSNSDEDDGIFFYCNGLGALKSLTEFGVEDFIVIFCFRFSL